MTDLAKHLPFDEFLKRNDALVQPGNTGGKVVAVDLPLEVGKKKCFLTLKKSFKIMKSNQYDKVLPSINLGKRQAYRHVDYVSI